MILLIATTAIFSWVLLCNQRTYKQQLKIIGVLGRYPDGKVREDFMQRFNQFGRVSYDAHLWRLVTFRDPYTLYPESIIADLGKVSA